MVEYLIRCHKSTLGHVCSTEHIIIDGQSTDGSVEWGMEQADMTFVSEPDKGMYDAINKGLKQAKGEYILHLNADEQILTNSLKEVARCFEDNPEIDIIFANAFLIKPDGSFLAFRKAYPAIRFFILSDHLYLLTCATFYRRRIFDEGNFFDPRFRIAGDTEFIARLLKNGYKSSVLNHFTSAFTITGSNLANEGGRQDENMLMRGLFYRRMRNIRPLIALGRRFYKFIHGAYKYDGPETYDLFTQSGHPQEFSVPINSKSFQWRYDP